MPSRRLVSPAQLDTWRADVAKALHRAQARMHRQVGEQLRAHGLTWESPSNKAAGLWSQAEWRRAVDEEMGPAAAKLAERIYAHYRSRVDVPGAWGGSDDQARLARLLLDRTKNAGRLVADAIAARGLSAGAGIRHPDAKPTIATAYQQAFAELDKLAERVASHMSSAAQAVLVETATKYEPLIANVWCCAFVPASRQSHMDADGQRQNAGVPFDIGGESLYYPGDPAGSDEETANCLCWLEVENLELTGDDEPAASEQLEDAG